MEPVVSNDVPVPTAMSLPTAGVVSSFSSQAAPTATATGAPVPAVPIAAAQVVIDVWCRGTSDAAPQKPQLQQQAEAEPVCPTTGDARSGWGRWLTPQEVKKEPKTDRQRRQRGDAGQRGF